MGFLAVGLMAEKLGLSYRNSFIYMALNGIWWIFIQKFILNIICNNFIEKSLKTCFSRFMTPENPKVQKGLGPSVHFCFFQKIGLGTKWTIYKTSQTKIHLEITWEFCLSSSSSVCSASTVYVEAWNNI